MKISFGQVYKLNFATEKQAQNASSKRNTDGRRIAEGKSVYYIPSTDMKAIYDITNMMTEDKATSWYNNLKYVTDIFKKNSIEIDC